MTFEVRGGTFTYPGAPAPILDDVGFTVPGRSLMAVLGPNGAGKTTLLRTMIGLQKWDRGRSLIDGRDIADMTPRALGRALSYVPQARAEEQMALRALEDIGAAALARMPCRAMSGGQFQMVLIARALVAEPSVLVLDEPETGLDFRNQLIVLRLLERLVAERGLTVIMNTHYPAHALRVADQVLMISAAHRAVVGPTGEVMNERTLAEVFGVDVRIAELEHNGTTVETVVPVSLSAKWAPPSE